MDLKLLLKRGALLAAANWPTVAIQFLAETTFQVLLGVPLIGAAILVAVLMGTDIAELLQGGPRQIFTTITSTLWSEPVALVAFMMAFVIVLLGGSVLLFLVKGGTVDVLLAANEASGPIEREPLTLDTFHRASQFTLQRFTSGCGRLSRHLRRRPRWLLHLNDDLLHGANHAIGRRETVLEDLHRGRHREGVIEGAVELPHGVLERLAHGVRPGDLRGGKLRVP